MRNQEPTFFSSFMLHSTRIPKQRMGLMLQMIFR